jgi:hypothetical protein
VDVFSRYCSNSASIQSVCRNEQNDAADGFAGEYDLLMDKKVRISKVQIDGDDGLIVTFSDGTVGGYVVEELLELRPIREQVDEPEAVN